jgi:hypothetical protein
MKFSVALILGGGMRGRELLEGYPRSAYSKIVSKKVDRYRKLKKSQKKFCRNSAKISKIMSFQIFIIK